MEHGYCLTLRVGSRQYSYSVVSSWQPPEDICMSILRALLSLILVTIVLPTIAQAGVYQLRVSKTLDTTNTQDLVLTDYVQDYEFFKESDYNAARLAYQDFQMKFRAFDRAIREERVDPTDERSQRRLCCRQEYLKASGILLVALCSAKR
jgi:hypothetical protein